jgi:hypothetical protein
VHNIPATLGRDYGEEFTLDALRPSTDLVSVKDVTPQVSSGSLVDKICRTGAFARKKQWHKVVCPFPASRALSFHEVIFDLLRCVWSLAYSIRFVLRSIN